MASVSHSHHDHTMVNLNCQFDRWGAVNYRVGDESAGHQYRRCNDGLRKVGQRLSYHGPGHRCSVRHRLEIRQGVHLTYVRSPKSASIPAKLSHGALTADLSPGRRWRCHPVVSRLGFRLCLVVTRSFARRRISCVKNASADLCIALGCRYSRVLPPSPLLPLPLEAGWWGRLRADHQARLPSEAHSSNHPKEGPSLRTGPLALPSLGDHNLLRKLDRINRKHLGRVAVIVGEFGSRPPTPGLLVP
jgi:hypothetical protein